MSEVTRIANVTDGTRATVRGEVRAARPPLLTSKLSEQPCVYWDIRQGMDGTPLEHEGMDFWVQESGGDRVLVRVPAVSAGEATSGPSSLDVDVRADRQQQIVEAASADIQAVSKRIKELKDILREGAGPNISEAAKERRRLAKVATLLCAVKAHARGKVHLGSSLKTQEAWIERNAHLADAEAGSRSVQLVTKRWEVVLAEGMEVSVTATFHMQPMPEGYSGGGGYRDRPMCLTAAGDPSQPVHVLGVGAAAPQEEEPPTTKKRADDVVPPTRTGMDPILKWTIALTGIASALAWLLR